MKQHKLFTLLLAAALVLGLGVVALAANIEQTINLTAPAEQLSVTVPTTLNLTLANDGKILSGTTVGDANAAIVNNSTMPIKVTDVTITAADGWSFTDDAGGVLADGAAKRVNMTFNSRSVASSTGAQLAGAIGSGGEIAADSSAHLDCTVAVKAAGHYVPKDLISVTYTIGWAD